MITDNELYWLAGLLEGEGSFQCGSYSKNLNLRVSLQMTDEDVVLRALVLIQRITGRQYSIYEYSPKREGRRCLTAYRVTVYGKDAIKVMKKVVRLMGQRRRKRIWQLLNGYRQPVEKPDLSNILSIVKLRQAV